MQVIRAPVLTLWAAVVARCLGFDRDEALSMGRVVAGLNAYLKGKSLGLYSPHPNALPDQRKHVGSGAVVYVELPKRAVAVMQTAQGLRALSKDEPVDPRACSAVSSRSLQSRFLMWRTQAAGRLACYGRFRCGGGVPEICPAISESGPRTLTDRSGREYRSKPLSRAARAVRSVTGNAMRRETANAYYRSSPYPDMLDKSA